MAWQFRDLEDITRDLSQEEADREMLRRGVPPAVRQGFLAYRHRWGVIPGGASVAPTDPVSEHERVQAQARSHWAAAEQPRPRQQPGIRQTSTGTTIRLAKGAPPPPGRGTIAERLGRLDIGYEETPYGQGLLRLPGQEQFIAPVGVIQPTAGTKVSPGSRLESMLREWEVAKRQGHFEMGMVKEALRAEPRMPLEWSWEYPQQLQARRAQTYRVETGEGEYGPSPFDLRRQDTMQGMFWRPAGERVEYGPSGIPVRRSEPLRAIPISTLATIPGVVMEGEQIRYGSKLASAPKYVQRGGAQEKVRIQGLPLATSSILAQGAMEPETGQRLRALIAFGTPLSYMSGQALRRPGLLPTRTARESIEIEPHLLSKLELGKTGQVATRGQPLTLYSLGGYQQEAYAPRNWPQATLSKIGMREQATPLGQVEKAFIDVEWELAGGGWSLKSGGFKHYAAEADLERMFPGLGGQFDVAMPAPGNWRMAAGMIMGGLGTKQLGGLAQAVGGILPEGVQRWGPETDPLYQRMFAEYAEKSLIRSPYVAPVSKEHLFPFALGKVVGALPTGVQNRLAETVARRAMPGVTGIEPAGEGMYKVSGMGTFLPTEILAQVRREYEYGRTRLNPEEMAGMMEMYPKMGRRLERWGRAAREPFAQTIRLSRHLMGEIASPGAAETLTQEQWAAAQAQAMEKSGAAGVGDIPGAMLTQVLGKQWGKTGTLLRVPLPSGGGRYLPSPSAMSRLTSARMVAQSGWSMEENAALNVGYQRSLRAAMAMQGASSTEAERLFLETYEGKGGFAERLHEFAGQAGVQRRAIDYPLKYATEGTYHGDLALRGAEWTMGLGRVQQLLNQIRPGLGENEEAIQAFQGFGRGGEAISLDTRRPIADYTQLGVMQAYVPREEYRRRGGAMTLAGDEMVFSQLFAQAERGDQDADRALKILASYMRYGKEGGFRWVTPKEVRQEYGGKGTGAAEVLSNKLVRQVLGGFAGILPERWGQEMTQFLGSQVNKPLRRLLGQELGMGQQELGKFVKRGVGLTRWLGMDVQGNITEGSNELAKAIADARKHASPEAVMADIRQAFGAGGTFTQEEFREASELGIQSKAMMGPSYNILHRLMGLAMRPGAGKRGLAEGYQKFLDTQQTSQGLRNILGFMQTYGGVGRTDPATGQGKGPGGWHPIFLTPEEKAASGYEKGGYLPSTGSMANEFAKWFGGAQELPVQTRAEMLTSTKKGAARLAEAFRTGTQEQIVEAMMPELEQSPYYQAVQELGVARREGRMAPGEQLTPLGEERQAKGRAHRRYLEFIKSRGMTPSEFVQAGIQAQGKSNLSPQMQRVLQEAVTQMGGPGMDVVLPAAAATPLQAAAATPAAAATVGGMAWEDIPEISFGTTAGATASVPTARGQQQVSYSPADIALMQDALQGGIGYTPQQRAHAARVLPQLAAQQQAAQQQGAPMPMMGAGFPPPPGGRGSYTARLFSTPNSYGWTGWQEAGQGGGGGWRPPVDAIQQAIGMFDKLNRQLQPTVDVLREHKELLLAGNKLTKEQHKVMREGLDVWAKLKPMSQHLSGWFERQLGGANWGQNENLRTVVGKTMGGLRTANEEAARAQMAYELWGGGGGGRGGPGGGLQRAMGEFFGGGGGGGRGGGLWSQMALGWTAFRLRQIGWYTYGMPLRWEQQAEPYLQAGMGFGMAMGAPTQQALQSPLASLAAQQARWQTFQTGMGLGAMGTRLGAMEMLGVPSSLTGGQAVGRAATPALFGLGGGLTAGLIAATLGAGPWAAPITAATGLGLGGLAVGGAAFQAGSRENIVRELAEQAEGQRQGPSPWATGGIILRSIGEQLDEGGIGGALGAIWDTLTLPGYTMKSEYGREVAQLGTTAEAEIRIQRAQVRIEQLGAELGMGAEQALGVGSLLALAGYGTEDIMRGQQFGGAAADLFRQLAPIGRLGMAGPATSAITQIAGSLGMAPGRGLRPYMQLLSNVTTEAGAAQLGMAGQVLGGAAGQVGAVVEPAALQYISQYLAQGMPMAQAQMIAQARYGVGPISQAAGMPPGFNMSRLFDESTMDLLSRTGVTSADMQRMAYMVSYGRDTMGYSMMAGGFGGGPAMVGARRYFGLPVPSAGAQPLFEYGPQGPGGGLYGAGELQQQALARANYQIQYGTRLGWGQWATQRSTPWSATIPQLISTLTPAQQQQYAPQIQAAQAAGQTSIGIPQQFGGEEFLMGIPGDIQQAQMNLQRFQQARPLQWSLFNLQAQGQLRGNEYQMAMATLQHRQALESLALQQRMWATRSTFQRQEFGFQWQQMQQARTWGREDFAFNRQVAGLQYGWQMEDLDRAIRFATGREKQQLIRERGRAEEMYSIQEGRRGTEEERQEKIWQQEDERFARQQQQFEEINALEAEQFEMRKRHLNETYALQMQYLAEQQGQIAKSIELQRELKKISEEAEEVRLKRAVAEAEYAQRVTGAQARLAAEGLGLSEAESERMARFREFITGELAKSFQDALTQFLMGAVGEPAFGEDMIFQQAEVGTEYAQAMEAAKAAAQEAFVQDEGNRKAASTERESVAEHLENVRAWTAEFFEEKLPEGFGDVLGSIDKTVEAWVVFEKSQSDSYSRGGNVYDSWWDFIEQMGSWISELVKKLQEARGTPPPPPDPPPPPPDPPPPPPPKAIGGSVAARRSYLVGEIGPELFVPSVNGYIVPNSALQGGTPVSIDTVTINVPPGNYGTPEELMRAARQQFEQMINELARNQRSRGGPWH